MPYSWEEAENRAGWIMLFIALLVLAIIACVIGGVAWLVGLSFWWGPAIVAAIVAGVFGWAYFDDWRKARAARAAAKDAPPV